MSFLLVGQSDSYVDLHHLSPTNTQWLFDDFGCGDPNVIKNSVDSYSRND